MKDIIFQAKVIDANCHATELNDQEITIKFRTMNPKAKLMQGLVAAWVEVKVKFLRNEAS